MIGQLLNTIIFLLLFSIFITRSFQDSESLKHRCFVRCLANCVLDDTILSCQNKCALYKQENLCNKNNLCWGKCKDLGLANVSPFKLPPENFNVEFNPQLELELKWNRVENAPLYVVQFHGFGESDWNEENELFSIAPFISNFSIPKALYCSNLELKVAAIDPTSGIGPFSGVFQLEKAHPLISAKLNLRSLVFDKNKFELENYESNGTITITLEYKLQKWLFDKEDLEIVPLFHMMSCADPDLTQAIPLPDFYKGSIENTIEAKIGADMMYRRCRFVFAVQEVRSKQCAETYHILASNSDYSPLEITCDKVTNCRRTESFKAPICGQDERFDYKIVEEDKINWNNPHSNITVNVSFVSGHRRSQTKQPIYYVALYGNATHYNNTEERTMLGVNIIKLINSASNCVRFFTNGTCQKTYPSKNSILITNLTMDTLYGVMICGIVDPRNLTFPPINVPQKHLRIRANSMEISSAGYRKSQKEQWFLFGGTSLALILAIFVASLLFCNQRQRNSIRKKQLTLVTMQREKDEQRYTDFPRKNDLWELERRNLILFDDKKLGSGAFGAVYLGKLIGSAKASKDAQSTLGVNLMRAENCYVAVKMLPEYADELSKSEFLREISLMKTLGYHERLVNMLACVTNSEPYCLVVEYCSDGDLLNFLKDRCNYMLKLDEKKIDYTNPDCEYEIDADMIMSVKQLLMYSVQISYGLEYLTQKGFVHRDVAARNVLVNNKNSAKIGDFGLCRYIYADSVNYKSKGGRLPVKWMSPEAIRHYEFTSKSDVWSFGILMFEIITLGGTPYPGVQPDDMLHLLESGVRIPQPDNCPDEYYNIMKDCWDPQPQQRPSFSTIRQKLAMQLEGITDEYSYLKLDAQKDYYNVEQNPKLEQIENLK